ncbi:MAG: hypothetical protein WB995_05480, partial [Candidatus Acidiferrales bacterium]
YEESRFRDQQRILSRCLELDRKYLNPSLHRGHWCDGTRWPLKFSRGFGVQTLSASLFVATPKRFG